MESVANDLLSALQIIDRLNQLGDEKRLSGRLLESGRPKKYLAIWSIPRPITINGLCDCNWRFGSTCRDTTATNGFGFSGIKNVRGVKLLTCGSRTTRNSLY